jgi:hypothetical protein
MLASHTRSLFAISLLVRRSNVEASAAVVARADGGPAPSIVAVSPDELVLAAAYDESITFYSIPETCSSRHFTPVSTLPVASAAQFQWRPSDPASSSPQFALLTSSSDLLVGGIGQEVNVYESGVSSFSWSTDGASLAFVQGSTVTVRALASGATFSADLHSESEPR